MTRKTNAGWPLPVGAALCAIVIAGASLIGWLLEIDGLKTIWPHAPPLPASSAFGLIAGAVALILSVLFPRARAAQIGLGLAVSAFGCAVLLEYVLGADFGFDNLAFHDPSAVFPGRPPIPGAAGAVALGFALALAGAQSAGLHVLRGVLAVGVIVIAFAGVLCLFISPIDPTVHLALFHYSINGSVALFLLGLGVLASSSSSRPVRDLVSVVAPCLGLAAMALLVVMTLFGVERQSELREQERIARSAVLALDQLLDSLRDAETGQRGFLLTGKDAYLQPYEEAAPKVASEIEQTAAAVGDNAEWRDRMKDIRSHAEAKLRELRQTIELKRAGDTAAALAIVDADDGKRLMDRLRQDIGEMETDWLQRADRLMHGADQILARLQYTTLISVSVVVALVGFFLFDGRRRVSEMRWVQRRLTAANEDLDRTVAQRTRDLSVALDAAQLALSLRDQAEMALRQSESQLTLLTEASSSAIYRMSPDWTEMRRLTGDGFLASVETTDDGWVGKFIPDSDRDRVLATIQTAIQTKSIFQLEHRVLQATGSVGWVLSRAVPVLDGDGEIVEWFGAATDITARKEGEEALRESERRLRRFYDSGLVGVGYWNMNGEVREANDKLLEMLGYTRDDMQAGRVNWRGISPPEYRDVSEAALKELEVTGAHAAPFERECIRKDGARVPMLVASAMLDEANGVAFALDITKRKQTEAALRRSEARLRFALASARAGAWSWDILADRLNWSPEVFALHGLDSDSTAVTVEKWLASVHPDDRGKARQTLEDALKGWLRDYRIEYRVPISPSGERWLLGLGTIELAVDGAPLRISGISIDITEQKRVETALRRSEAALRQNQAHLRQAAGSAQLTYADIDLATGRISIGENFEKVMGYAPPVTEGAHGVADMIAKLIRTEDGSASPKALDAVQSLLAGEPQVKLEHRLIDDDGAPRWLQSVWSVEKDPDQQPARIFLTNTDITTLVEGREALAAAKAEAERANLAKSSFLAAASHDLRQPVQSLVLLLALLERQVTANAKAVRTIEMMKSALGGLNGLLTGILDLSRLDAGAMEPTIEIVRLDSVLDRLATEYAPKATARGLRLRVRKRELCVSTDPGLLERALRNLIENALRYTTAGGVLIGARRRGGVVRVDVVDTGIGVPFDKQTEIFEEFRQLNNPGRDLGRGLGLGLAIVARVASLLGAKVEVSSRPGRGSRFSLVLPRSLALAAPEDNAREEAAEARGSILIIEDNEILRHSLEAMVSDWGYAAFGAINGEEAIKLSSLGLRFDAVVTDFRLGVGLNGVEAALKIERDANRVLPKLVLTGDTAAESLAEIRESGFQCFHKPVAAEALRRKLAELMRA